MIFPPRALLREAEKVGAGQVMMMPDFRPTHAAEKTLRIVAMDALAERVGLPVIDAVQRV